jgi:hypothetical protein
MPSLFYKKSFLLELLNLYCDFYLAFEYVAALSLLYLYATNRKNHHLCNEILATCRIFQTCVTEKNGWKRAQIARDASVCFQPFHTVLQSRKGKFAA